MKTPSRLGLALLFAVAMCDAGWRWQSSQGADVPVAVVPEAVEGQSCTDYRVVREGLIPMPDGVPAAHASSLVAFPDTHPLHAQKALAAFCACKGCASGNATKLLACAAGTPSGMGMRPSRTTR